MKTVSQPFTGFAGTCIERGSTAYDRSIFSPKKNVETWSSCCRATSARLPVTSIYPCNEWRAGTLFFSSALSLLTALPLHAGILFPPLMAVGLVSFLFGRVRDLRVRSRCDVAALFFARLFVCGCFPVFSFCLYFASSLVFMYICYPCMTGIK